MTHTFNGRCFRIILGPYEGLCDVPKTKELQLYIFSDLNTKQGIITCIHEALHAEDSNLPEKSVEKVATEIGNFLWKLNYRNVGKQK